MRLQTFFLVFIALLAFACGNSGKTKVKHNFSEVVDKVEASVVPPQSFTVTFYLNKPDATLGNSLTTPSPQTVVKGTQAKEPPEKPILTNAKAGFFSSQAHSETLQKYADQPAHFFGWVNFEDGTIWDFSKRELNKNLKLYAKWLPRIEVASEDAQKYPTNPIYPTNFDAGLVTDLTAENADYKAYFDGWFSNADGSGERWDFNKPSSENLTLYGKWSETKYQPTGEARPKDRSGDLDYFYTKGTLYALLYDEGGTRKSGKDKIQPKEIDTSEITWMGDLFLKKDLFNEEIGGWNLEKVESLNHMFHRAKAFNQPIGGWNLEKVKNLNGMFHEAKAFNQPIGGWNVGNVKDMSWMFSSYWPSNATKIAFNQDLREWNVGKVQKMENIFKGTSAFKQNMDSWEWKPSCAMKKKSDAKNDLSTMFQDSGVSKYPAFYVELSNASDDNDSLESLGSQNCTPVTP